MDRNSEFKQKDEDMMRECSMYLPTMNPDKFLSAPGSPYDMPVESADKTVYFSWMIPTSFITVGPELSFCWLNLGEPPVEVDWLLRYRYFNEGSCLGYFDGDGMPVITFDGGPSEMHTMALKANGFAEKDIIQKTPAHRFIKKDRRSGTFVEISIQPQSPLEEIYLMGAEIKFKEYPRVVEPVGRKRTYKRKRYDDEPYPYDDFAV